MCLQGSLVARQCFYRLLFAKSYLAEKNTEYSFGSARMNYNNAHLFLY